MDQAMSVLAVTSSVAAVVGASRHGGLSAVRVFTMSPLCLFGAAELAHAARTSLSMSRLVSERWR